MLIVVVRHVLRCVKNTSVNDDEMAFLYLLVVENMYLAELLVEFLGRYLSAGVLEQALGPF